MCISSLQHVTDTVDVFGSEDGDGLAIEWMVTTPQLDRSHNFTSLCCELFIYSRRRAVRRAVLYAYLFPHFLIRQLVCLCIPITMCTR
jgi:hypothetical protein